MKQFTIQDARAEEQEALAHARHLAVVLIDDLKAQGYRHFAPAPKPDRLDGTTWEVFNECRILVMWIPPWSMHLHAGLFAARADVMAMKENGA